MTHTILLTWPPFYVVLGGLIAAVIGLIFFVLATTESPAGEAAGKWESLEGFLRNLSPKKIRWREIVKDIGIGFLVAGVVSVTYEWATRTTAEREEGLEVVNSLMASIIGRNVWEEIRNETVKVPRVRRNLVIDVGLQRDWELANGQTIVLPKCKAVMSMRIGYDLYLVSSDEPQTPVQQAVDYYMWDDELQLPRFESVTVSTQIDAFHTKDETISGDELKQISDGKGSIILEGKHAIKFPPPEMNKPVRITTKRYELVNTPGDYNLTMGALTARVPSLEQHTITINFTGGLDDVEPNITTNWSGHKFTPNGNKSAWTFDGIMLPGQGIQIELVVPPDKKSPARAPCG
jgi:hypothetical protein